MIDGLADVMQQAGSLGQGYVRPQLGGQQTGDVSHFDGVIEHVLAVACAVAHSAQDLHQLRVQAVNAGFKHRSFALLLDGGFHLCLGLFHHLLDAGGVNAAVGNQFFQSDAGGLPAHWVKGR